MEYSNPNIINGDSTEDYSPKNRRKVHMVTGQGKMEVTKEGAMRESNKGRGRFDLLPYEAIEALAKWYEAGGEKYPERNWEDGLSVKDCINRMIRHSLKAGNGWTDEDHLAAVMWNAAAAITMMQRHPEFNDHIWHDSDYVSYNTSLAWNYNPKNLIGKNMKVKECAGGVMITGEIDTCKTPKDGVEIPEFISKGFNIPLDKKRETETYNDYESLDNHVHSLRVDLYNLLGRLISGKTCQDENDLIKDICTELMSISVDSRYYWYSVPSDLCDLANKLLKELS